MALRDRRGPLVALVLAIGYALVVISALLEVARGLGWVKPLGLSPAMRVMMTVSVVGLAWRTILRFLFTSREYGWPEGCRAVLRIPVANLIAIVAGRRAFSAYLRSLSGGTVLWEKTVHRGHPVHAIGLKANA
jgi:adsorption protein B